MKRERRASKRVAKAQAKRAARQEPSGRVRSEQADVGGGRPGVTGQAPEGAADPRHIAEIPPQERA